MLLQDTILMSQKECMSYQFINLHWLPIAGRIKFKILMFAYKTTSGSVPKFITSDLCASRSLCSASERRFIVRPKEAQNHFHRLLHYLFICFLFFFFFLFFLACQ